MLPLRPRRAASIGRLVLATRLMAVATVAFCAFLIFAVATLTDGAAWCWAVKLTLAGTAITLASVAVRQARAEGRAAAAQLHQAERRRDDVRAVAEEWGMTVSDGEERS